MDSGVVGLAGVVIVALIAEGVGICLRRPLGVLLRAEKGSERSEFWSAYIRVVLLLVPAALALMSFPSSIHEEPLMALVSQLRWGLVGILITLAVAGHSLNIVPQARPATSPFASPIVPPGANGPVR
jgi:hypothetical protein